MTNYELSLCLRLTQKHLLASAGNSFSSALKSTETLSQVTPSLMCRSVPLIEHVEELRQGLATQVDMGGLRWLKR